MSHPPGSTGLNWPSLLCVLVVESETTDAAPLRHQADGAVGNRRTQMFDRIAQWQPDQGAAVAAAAVTVSAMGGYILTRGLSGGFLGDHGDVGNWHCPLGIAALSVESVIILLVLLVALGAWQARIHAASVAAAPRPPAQRVSEYSQPR